VNRQTLNYAKMSAAFLTLNSGSGMPLNMLLQLEGFLDDINLFAL